MTHLHRTTAFAFAASALFAALPAGAADMVFTPSTGGGVVVESAPGVKDVDKIAAFLKAVSQCRR